MRFPRFIYALQHNVTKKIYIGSSRQPSDRYWAHIWSLRRGQHPVPELQQDFVDYGEDFSFFILEEIMDYSSKGREYDWMEKYQTGNKEFGYNNRDPHFRRIHSPEDLPLKEGLPDMPTK